MNSTILPKRAMLKLDGYMLKFLLLAAAGASLASGQQYTISTAAGGSPPATPATATGVAIGQPEHATSDKAGNIYFSSSTHCVFKLSTSGVLTLVAGNSRAGFSGDGGPAVNAQLNTPQGVALDPSGNLYIADSLNNRVRMVTPQGIISTFAGTGSSSPDSVPGSFNDGGPATQGLLKRPLGLATDSAGNVYIADTGDNLIREVTVNNGLIQSIAGDGYPSYHGEDGPAVSSELHTPSDVAVDSSSNVWIADTVNEYIREIVASTGYIHHMVGNNGTPNAGPGTEGYTGDGAAAQLATLYSPVGVALDSTGNLYIVEQGDSRVREVNNQTGTITFPGTNLKVETGWIETVVGTDVVGFSSSGTTANATPLNYPTGMTVDASGNMFIADTLNLRLRKVSNNVISTAAGNGLLSYGGDGGSAASAQLNAPQGVAVDPSGDLFIADTNNNSIREVTPNGTITTVAGSGASGSGAAGNGTNQFNGPLGMAADSNGNVYIADSQNARVVKLSSAGGLSTVAGNGTPGYGGDGGAATSAQLNTPSGVAVDSAGNLYIADFSNNRIRKVTPTGTISTVAGNGNTGYTGDGGTATNAQIAVARGVAVDGSGNLYIADTGNNAVRRVTPAGIINTIAIVNNPVGIATDSLGNVYATDGSSQVYEIYPFSTPIVVTLAGNGSSGYTGDGGLGTSGQLFGPTGIALDSHGNIYVADTSNNAVRKLQFAGSVATVSALVNAASDLPGVVSPGEMVVLYGSALGPATLTAAQPSKGVYGDTLAGTSVFFNGVQAPIYYTSATQVAAVAPFELNGSQAEILVQYQGQTSSAFTASVAAVSPGIFTLNGSGTGQAVAINSTDSSVNGGNHPASAGSYVSLYLTGLGQTSPAGQDGVENGYNGAKLSTPVASLTVTIGGKTTTTNYAGAAPLAIAGVTQINALVPTGLTAGNVAVSVQVGGVSTQPGVTIAVSGN
jgi:trimeric autotransporter adhesin